MCSGNVVICMQCRNIKMFLGCCSVFGEGVHFIYRWNFAASRRGGVGDDGVGACQHVRW